MTTQFQTLAEALKHVATAQQKNTFYDQLIFQGSTQELFQQGWELSDKPLPADQSGKIYYTLSNEGMTVKVRVNTMNAKTITIKTNSQEKTIGDNKFEANSRFLVELS
jgi:hypothetical protein